MDRRVRILLEQGADEPLVPQGAASSTPAEPLSTDREQVPSTSAGDQQQRPQRARRRPARYESGGDDEEEVAEGDNDDESDLICIDDIDSEDPDDDEEEDHGMDWREKVQLRSVERVLAGSSANADEDDVEVDVVPYFPHDFCADDADDQIETEDVVLPEHGGCSSHKLNLVATTDASKALKDPAWLVEKFYSTVTGVAWGEELQKPTSAELRAYQGAFNQAMGKLRAVWRFQSRSVLGSNVIRARLSTLFACGQHNKVEFHV